VARFRRLSLLERDESTVTFRRLLGRILGPERAYWVRQSMGLATWGTKSFEFWTLLAITLWTVRPRSIVEFGSGRSTSYLADYAMKEGVQFASIEQNSRWARRVRLALRAGLVDPACVHHVPVVGDWYDSVRVDRLVPHPYEMLYVDGPIGVQDAHGRGDRTSSTALRWLTPAAAKAKVIVIDDVHRPKNLAMSTELAAAGGLSTMYLDYTLFPGEPVPATIAVSVGSESLTRLREICAAASISLTDSPDQA